jgi:hypothetical protein
MPRRMLSTTIGAMLAAAALLAGTGCGAKEAEVAKSAFSTKIDRATVALDVSVKAAGSDMHLSMRGPFSSNGDRDLPSVDWRVALKGLGPEPVDARVVSSATNAWVQYDGETYEVGEDKIAELAKGQKGAQQPTPADLQGFLAKAKDWFADTATEEDATLDGEDVTRVTGTLDVSKALADIMDIAKQQPGALDKGAALGMAPALLERFLTDPRFTLDVAKSDGSLRRIAATMDLSGVPGGGTISFSLQLSDVGKPVTITPLSGGRPIEELGGKLGATFGGAAAIS